MSLRLVCMGVAMSARTINVGRRYAGPPDCANGGYFAGLVAGRFGRPIEVTLKRPVPLDTSLSVQWFEEVALVCNGDELLAVAEPGALEMAVPGPPTYQEAVYATRFLASGMYHPFPGCFVCGSHRTDGLRILPGRVDGTELVAAPWVPGAEFAGPDGAVRSEIVWASLDCPGGWAAMWDRQPRPVVLGRIAARLDRAVHPNERYVLVGWRITDEGRKHTVGTALCDTDGALYAVARATWIEVG